MLQNLWYMFLDGKLIEEFVVELLVAEVLFFGTLERRKNFAMRATLSLIVMLVLSFYWPYKTDLDSLTNIVRLYSVGRYLLLFVLSLVCISLCWKCSVHTLIFFGTGAYAMQHLAFCCVRMELYLLERWGIGVNSSGYFAIACGTCLISYGIVYLVFIRYILREQIAPEKEIYLPSLLVLIFTVTVNYYWWNNLACNVYGAVICILMCWIMAGIFRYGKLEQEMNRIGQMVALKEEHYRYSKENIDAINMKCHDLKHQISRIRRMTEGGEDAYLSEIEKNIMLYDSIAATGSEVLDVILTEKKMFCDQNGITLTYMIDGEQLSFVKDSDLYTLFGNALDNAIEGVMRLENTNERSISMAVKGIGSYVSIHLDNPCEERLTFTDGLPMTQKADQNYHGFGLKSIRWIVQKYHGEMKVSADGERFNLNIMLEKPE